MPTAMRALLDVNMLVALHDSEHVHHDLVSKWFTARAAQGFTTCPTTQNGCLRILSQPNYPNPRTIQSLVGALGVSFGSQHHEFWPDDISLLDDRRFRRDRIHGHRQSTDLYLLALAVRRKARLVTLDAGIAVSAVVGADDDHLVTLAA